MLLPPARGPLALLASHPDENLRLIREDPIFAVSTAGLDEEALKRTAFSAAVVTEARQITSTLRRLGLAAGLVVASLATPFIAQWVAGPQLPRLTLVDFLLSAGTTIVTSFAVVGTGFLIGGSGSLYSTSTQRLMDFIGGVLGTAFIATLCVASSFGILASTYDGDAALWAAAGRMEGALATALIGVPIVVSVALAGRTGGRLVASGFTSANPWDVLRVDMLQLALVAQDPGLMGLDVEGAKKEAQKKGFHADHLARAIDVQVDKYFAPLLEEAARRTIANFSGVFRGAWFAADASTSMALARRGAALAAGIRSVKLRDFFEETQTRESVCIEKFQQAARNEWHALTPPGDYTLTRPWWRAPLGRFGLALVLIGAAVSVPFVLKGSEAATVRGGLIIVAITALFSPLSVSGNRVYDVLKLAAPHAPR